jgi:hypothetical protein
MEAERAAWDRTEGDAIDDAVKALEAAARALPDIVAAASAGHENIWAVVRPRYLELYRGWGQFLKVAQSVGVARKPKRLGRSMK